MNEHFSDEENLAELVSQMTAEDQHRFNKYGHVRIEAAFLDRLFILYKPTGLRSSGAHRDPEILDYIKVVDFGVEPRNGCYAVLKGQKFETELTITHVPKKLFGYPIYISIPPHQKLRWDARLVGDRVSRSLSFALLIKARNKSSFYSKGNVYCETPNDFRALYPTIPGEGEFTF